MLDDFNRDEGLRYFHRGLALEQANRMPEAVEAYRQAVSHYPQLREAHAALAFYYQRSGLLAKAAEQFETVVSLEGDFLAYFNLGYVLIELERYEEALRAFEQCLKLEPQDPATYYEMGYIFYMRNAYEQALEYLHLPLSQYPDDWEVHNLIGKCHLGLRQYDDALAAFGQALMCAHMPRAQAELLDNMATVERYREFGDLHSDKDQMYAREGVIYIGSARDNGLEVTEADNYHFTYPDIGTTLHRFMALQQGYHWHFTSLVAVDKAALPLAVTLSHLWQLPLRNFDELQNDDSALIVMAVAREVELLLLALERAPCNTITFCLGLNWLRHSNILPDIIGIAARGACSVPWESELRRLRAEGATRDEIDACVHSATAQVMQAVSDTPRERNLPRQVRYYTRNHRRLSFSTSAT